MSDIVFWVIAYFMTGIASWLLCSSITYVFFWHKLVKDGASYSHAVAVSLVCLTPEEWEAEESHDPHNSQAFTCKMFFFLWWLCVPVFTGWLVYQGWKRFELPKIVFAPFRFFTSVVNKLATGEYKRERESLEKRVTDLEEDVKSLKKRPRKKAKKKV